MSVAECRRVGLRVRQLHVRNERGDSKVACEVACTWLLTQARNIKVMCLSNTVLIASDILQWEAQHRSLGPFILAGAQCQGHLS